MKFKNLKNPINEIQFKENNVGDRYTDGRYLQANSNWHENDSIWKAGKINAMLQRNNIVSKTVCEIGCGAGEILKQLSIWMPKSNFYGFEPSPQAYEICRKKQNETVKYECKDITQIHSNFDVLLCIDVFEHVEDYMGFVRSLKSIAHHKIFHIPIDLSVLAVLRNSMLDQRKSVGHLHYFTKETALATLIDCGHEIVDFAFTPYLLELPPQSMKAKLARFPCQMLYSIAPEFTVKMLGVSSLLVLTK